MFMVTLLRISTVLDYAFSNLCGTREQAFIHIIRSTPPPKQVNFVAMLTALLAFFRKSD